MNTLLGILLDSICVMLTLCMGLYSLKMIRTFYQQHFKGKRYRLILRVSEEQECPVPEPEKEYLMESDVLLALRLVDTIHYLVEKADVDPEIAGRFTYAQTKKMAGFADTVSFIKINSPHFGEHKLAVTCKTLRTHDRGRCKENPI